METMSQLKKAILLGTAALGVSAIASTANAAWLVPNGVWVSNVCRAPSGMCWVYPVAYAITIESAAQ